LYSCAGSKFDELYQQALRNAESILSDSGNPADGHVTLHNLHSPIHSADNVPADNDSRREASTIQSGLHPSDTLLHSAQNGSFSTHSNSVKPPESLHPFDKSVASDNTGLNGNFSVRNNNSMKLADSVPLQQLVGQHLSSVGQPQEVNQSVVSGRSVDGNDVTGEYTTEDEDVEEIILNSQ